MSIPSSDLSDTGHPAPEFAVPGVSADKEGYGAKEENFRSHAFVGE